MARSSDSLSRIDSAFSAVGAGSYDHRWVVVTLATALLTASLVLASQVRVDNSYENCFDPQDRTFQPFGPEGIRQTGGAALREAA